MLKKIKSESGFSLIEISIVVAIAGVLAAMSIYSFRGETSTFGADKALLRDTLVRARDMARGRVNCVLVRVDTTLLQITMEAFQPGAGKDCAHPGGSLLVLPPVQFSTDAQFSAFSNSGGPIGYTLMFNADGGLVNGTVVSISMIHADKTATAKIYPAIGQIRVQ